MKIPRIGLYGGSFDPFHLGHRAVAEVALAEAKLDELVLLPARISPHKQELPPVEGEQRWLMAILGTLDHPLMRVERWDLDRHGPSYTLDTVQLAREFYGTQAELFWLIGADHLEALREWYRIEAILEICSFLVVPREDCAGEALCTAMARALPSQYEDRLMALDMPPIDVSASEIRRRACGGESLEGLVPGLTALYLERYNLYRPASPMLPPQRS